MKKGIILALFVGFVMAFVASTTVLAQANQEEILHFSSETCQACTDQPELVQKVAAEYGIQAVLLQAEDNQDLVKQYGVASLPMLILLRDDQEIGRLDGAISVKDLESFLASSENAVPAESDEPQKNTSIVPDEDNSVTTTGEKNSSKLPIIIGATALAAVTTAGIVISKRKLAGKKPVQTSTGLVASPADGSMVSPAQAKNEQALLDQGFIYNSQKDGFDYIPKAEVQADAQESIISKDVKKMRAKAKTRKGLLDDEIKKVHQERVDNIREDMEFDQKQYRRHIKRAETMDALSKGAQVVGEAADVSIDVMSEMTGPAGKAIKKGYETAKDVVTVADHVANEGAEGLVTSAKEIASGKARGKVMDKMHIPKSKAGSKVLRHAQDSVTQKVIDKKIETNVQKPLENISKSTKK